MLTGAYGGYQAATVGLLHYAAAMIASRHAFFIAGMPEMRPGSGENDCERRPCLSCIESIISCLLHKKLIHVGLVRALCGQNEMDAARGGWSRCSLLLAYSSVNRSVQYVVDHHVSICNGEHSTCSGQRLPTMSLLGRMRGLLPARDVPELISVLQDVEHGGLLLDFVQDIYMQDEQLGTELALLY